jgi:hypothetical protein
MTHGDEQTRQPPTYDAASLGSTTSASRKQRERQRLAQNRAMLRGMFGTDRRNPADTHLLDFSRFGASLSGTAPGRHESVWNPSAGPSEFAWL